MILVMNKPADKILEIKEGAFYDLSNSVVAFVILEFFGCSSNQILDADRTENEGYCTQS